MGSFPIKQIAFMEINNMGIFNGTFSHSGNRKSTFGNEEKVCGQNGSVSTLYHSLMQEIYNTYLSALDF